MYNKSDNKKEGYGHGNNSEGRRAFVKAVKRIQKLQAKRTEQIQAVIQVMKDGKEILIPIHDDIIKKVDKKAKVLTVKAPEGLIDMYLNM